MKSGKKTNEGEGPRPASDTKHEEVLEYAIASLDNRQFRLRQLSSEGTSTGTTLWLSSQILVCYLIETERKLQQRRQRRIKGTDSIVTGANNFPPTSTLGSYAAQTAAEKPRRRPLAVDLGAGVGLTSLVLASLGFDVITTDIEPPFSSVLVPNMAANGHHQTPPSSITNGHDLAKAVDKAQEDKSLQHGHHQDGSVVAQKVDWTLESDVDALLREVEARGGVDLVVTADTLYSTLTVDSLLRCLARLKGHQSAIEKQMKGEIANTNSEELLDANEEESKASVGQVKSRGKREKKEVSTSTRILVALERRDPSLIEASLKKAASVEFGLCPAQIPQKLLNKAVDEHLGGGQCWTRADWEGVEIWQM